MPRSCEGSWGGGRVGSSGRRKLGRPWRRWEDVRVLAAGDSWLDRIRVAPKVFGEQILAARGSRRGSGTPWEQLAPAGTRSFFRCLSPRASCDIFRRGIASLEAMVVSAASAHRFLRLLGCIDAHERTNSRESCQPSRLGPLREAICSISILPDACFAWLGSL